MELVDQLIHVLITPDLCCDVFLLDNVALGSLEKAVGEQRGTEVEFVVEDISGFAEGTEIVQSSWYAAFGGRASQLRRLEL